MKRILAALAVVLLLFVPSAQVLAAPTVTVSIAGPASVHVGTAMTVSVTLNVSGGNPNLVNFRIYIQYSGGQLTYQGIGGQLAGWSYVTDPKPGQVTILANDSDQTHPITATKRVFTVTFYVNSDARQYGDKINAFVATPLDSDTNYVSSTASTTAEYTLPHTQFSTTLLDPLSGNSNLASLSVDEGALVPAFTAATTAYSIDVPFATAKATIRATPADATSKVTINSPTLVAGETADATVVVTAASGTTKTYTIHIKRAQDPNYKPSTDATLASLSVDGFFLSPVFDPGTDSYVVWLPHETDRITVAAKPASAKATFVVAGGDSLVSGQDNLVTVTVTAADGSTSKVYTIDAKRPDPWGGFTTPTTAPTGQPTTPPTPGEGTPYPTPTQPIAPSATPFPFVPVGIVLVVSIGLGIFITSLLDKGGKKGGRGHPPTPPPPGGGEATPDGGTPPSPASPPPPSAPPSRIVTKPERIRRTPPPPPNGPG